MTIKPYIVFYIFTGCILVFIFVRTPPSFDFVYRKCNYTSHPSKEVKSRLMDLDFRYDILNLPCEEVNPEFVIFVSTATGNFEKREAIRTAWGKNQSVPILFALGMVNNEAIQDQINMENLKYSDIVQGNFIDSYRNLSYKHVMMLKYLNEYCSETKYLVKLDDDVFVNIPQLKNFIINDLSTKFTHNLILGDVYVNAPVLREPSKWRVLPEEFSPDVYPTYCPGYRIIYSMDIVQYLYRQSQNKAVEYFWVDDVFVSGILAMKLKDVHRDIGALTMRNEKIQKYLNGANEYSCFVFSSFSFDVSQNDHLMQFLSNKTHCLSLSSRLSWMN